MPQNPGEVFFSHYYAYCQNLARFENVLYLCRHMAGSFYEELFQQVWSEKYLDSNNTVMTHVARIREKLYENARNPSGLRRSGELVTR